MNRGLGCPTESQQTCDSLAGDTPGTLRTLWLGFGCFAVCEEAMMSSGGSCGGGRGGGQPE